MNFDELKYISAQGWFQPNTVKIMSMISRIVFAFKCHKISFSSFKVDTELISHVHSDELALNNVVIKIRLVSTVNVPFINKLNKLLKY